MNSFTRGVKNAFRNGIRTVAICLILALVIGLTLAMLAVNSAVNKKVADVKSSIGNNITISAAGMRGPGGGMMRMNDSNAGRQPGQSGESSSNSEPSNNSDNTSSNNLTNDDLTKIKKVSHITSVAALLTERVDSDDTNLESLSFGKRPDSSSLTSADDSNDSDNSDSSDSNRPTMPISVSGVSDLSTIEESLGTISLSSGSKIDLTGSDKVALIGDQLAEKNNLKVGSTFKLYDTEITVKGVISSGDSDSASSTGRGRDMSLGSVVVIPLGTLQDLADTNEISSMVATVDNVSNTDDAVAAIEKAIGQSDDGNNIAEISSDKDKAESTINSLENIAKTSLLSVIICLVVAIAIVFLAMLMVVRERRNEIGIMKAIGAKSRVIVTQFVAESMVITMLASVIGLGIGIVGAAPLTKALTTSSAQTNQTNSDQPAEPGGNSETSGRPAGGPGRMMRQGMNDVGEVVAQVDWTIVLYAVAGCLLVAGLGATAASLVAMRIKPAEAVRAE